MEQGRRTEPTGVGSSALDPVGNRLSESSTLADISSGGWSYNPDDEVSSESYDANGNVTSTGGKSLTYDSENLRDGFWGSLIECGSNHKNTLPKRAQDR